MVYYTWSQGFRPGGFDENGGTKHIYGTDGAYQYVLGNSWKSDQLTKSHPSPVQRDPTINERHSGKNEQHDENVNDRDGVGEHGTELIKHRAAPT
jgi:hypothetical protein